LIGELRRGAQSIFYENGAAGKVQRNRICTISETARSNKHQKGMSGGIF